MELSQLFHDHIAERRRIAEEALERSGHEALIISSGEPFTYFADDQEAPHHATPHFAHWTPLAGPHHALLVVKGRKPRLLRYAPEDFWYEQQPLGTPFWAGEFEIQEFPTQDALWEALGRMLPGTRTAYIGNETARAGQAGLDPNPEALVARLDWFRGIKSAYEIRCLEEATVLGARGHVAGRKAFLEGKSELEIHHAFVQALGCLDHQLAFASIVALNEKGATLHYENKRDVRQGKVLLLDCGARVRDYASDITRTTAGPDCDPRFRALIQGMEKLELELCAEVKAGLPFPQLHHQCHVKVAELLVQAGILRCGVQEALDKQFTRPFLPHGLGHHLGIQVHDVGGKLASPDGAFQAPPAEYPNLRTTRTLEVGHVVTIEPGIYFIPMLLRPFREGEHAASFDWKLIDELSPLGGIRIEDDVVVTPQGPRNLTREVLPD